MEDLQKLLPGFPRIAPQAPFLQVAPNMNMAANMLPMQHLQPTGQLEYKVRGGARSGAALGKRSLSFVWTSHLCPMAWLGWSRIHLGTAPPLPSCAKCRFCPGFAADVFPLARSRSQGWLFLQEQSLLQPPTLQLLNGMGPLGRRASDGGANIQLHAQQLLKRPRGPSPLVTMTPVSSPKAALVRSGSSLCEGSRLYQREQHRRLAAPVLAHGGWQKGGLGGFAVVQGPPPGSV